MPQGISAASVTNKNVRLLIPGIAGNVPLDKVSYVAASGEISLAPTGGTPSLTDANNGVMQLVTADVANAVLDLDGAPVAPGEVIYQQNIVIPAPPPTNQPPTMAYADGLPASTITAAGSGWLAGNIRVTVTDPA